MIIEWEGRERVIDSSKVSITQAFVIKDTTKDDQYPGGRGLKAWQEGLNEVEPSCIRALYWLMLQQEGTQCPCLGLEFPAIEFNNAVVTGIQKEQATAEKEAADRKAAADADAAAAEVPTSAPSPGPPSPPDTTRVPERMPASSS